MNVLLSDCVPLHQRWLEHIPNGKQLKMVDIELDGETLADENLSYSIFDTTSFKNLTFDTVQFKNSVFDNCTFTDCTFVNCDLSDSIFKNSRFENSNLYFNNLDSTTLFTCQFIHTDCLLNDIDKTSFDECTLESSDIYYNKYIHPPLGLEKCTYASNDEHYKNTILHHAKIDYESCLNAQKNYSERMLEAIRNSPHRNDAMVRIEKHLLNATQMNIEAELKKYHEATQYKQKESLKSVNEERKSRQKTYKSSLTNAIKKHINLLDYAQQCGYTPMKIGQQWTIKEMQDTVRINPSPKDPDVFLFVRHSSQQAGSVIDFEMMIQNCSQDTAIKNLRSLLPSMNQLSQYQKTLDTPLLDKVREEKDKALKLPPVHDGSYKRVIAYLNQTRGISYDVITDMIKSKHLYEDKRHNAVFVGYDKDGQASYACKRGTTTDKRYIGEAENSNKNVGIFINNQSNKLFISESMIDNLSIMTLLKNNGVNYKNFNYLALGGVSTQSISYHLKDMPNIQNLKVYITSDNDTAGAKGRSNIKSELLKLGVQGKNMEDKIPVHKDMNEDLIKSRPNKQQPKFSSAPKIQKNIRKTKNTNYEYER